MSESRRKKTPVPDVVLEEDFSFSWMSSMGWVLHLDGRANDFWYSIARDEEWTQELVDECSLYMKQSDVRQFNGRR